MESAKLGRRPSGYRLDPNLGEIYQEMPSWADDLTLIKGVETREAVILNRLGVYFLDQIANWQDRQVAAFASELGISKKDVIRQNWIPQARDLVAAQSVEPPILPVPVPVPVVSPPPAPAARTLTLLVCALLMGCFIVYLLNRDTHHSSVGVLAADSTSLRVPADSRMVEAKIKAGDEVFTGEILLTLEKTEHLAQIAAQQRTVERLENELKDAEARAVADLQWRTQALEAELDEVRRQSQRLRRIAEHKDEFSAQIDRHDTSETVTGNVQTVSDAREIPSARDRVNSLVFMSGPSDASTLNVARKNVVIAMPPAKAETDSISEQKYRIDFLKAQAAAEADALERRSQRLQQLKTDLPNQVRSATGVSRLAAEFADASRILTQMQTVSRRVDVLCPSYGTVSQVNFREGEEMVRGQEMAKILHTNRRYVIARIPVQQLAELKSGQEVKLVFPNDDQCSGIIQEEPIIAENAQFSGENFVSVRIEATGRHWPDLPIGTHLKVLIP